MTCRISAQDLSVVNRLAKTHLGIEQIDTIQRLGGLTNRSYYINTAIGEYIIRIPGEGTQDLICRSDERISTELACRLGIDSPLLYFGDDGTKITEYIQEAQTMSQDSLKEEVHIQQVARIFHKLHTCGEDSGVAFEVFDMAANYENILSKNHVPIYEDYPEIKHMVMMIKKEIDDSGDIIRVPCHNDSLCENWVQGKDKMFLVDWEYAGMNDPMWDLADVSIEAEYTKYEDSLLLYHYFGRSPSHNEIRRFQANKIYLDYLWTLWGKTRVPYDGEAMELYAAKRYQRLKNNINAYMQMIHTA